MDVLDKGFDEERIEEAFNGLGSAADVQPSVLSSSRRRRVRFAALTDRKREVFRYLLNRLTSREIAELLGLSPRTVKVHRAHVQEKLRARTVQQLVSEYSRCIASRELPSLPAHRLESSTIRIRRRHVERPIHPDLEFNGSLLEDLNLFCAVVRKQEFAQPRSSSGSRKRSFAGRIDVLKQTLG